MSRPLPGSLYCKAVLAGAPVLLGLLAGSPALADVKDGVDAWSRGDYAAALRVWRGLAEQGDPDALFNLGQAYKLGRGVEQDLAKAEELFGQAAAKGHLQAADNYGLLLFQRGEHARALPFLVAAAERGEPRAQYLLGLIYFNGEGVPSDWVRAYALVSLAHQAGIPQAAPALAEMDKYIPLEQRQQSVALASSLSAQAQANRVQQLAAADLKAADAPLQDDTPRGATLATDGGTPAWAGADYARPGTGASTVFAAPVTAKATPAPAPSSALAPSSPPPASAPPARPAAKPARPIAAPAPASTPAPASPPPPARGGTWKLQLGAFGVPGNAEGLWKRVKNRPELAGHQPLFVKAGRLTLLQAGGFASRDEAQTACKRLTAAGFDCLTAGN